jgi:hypothetical protein
MEEVGSGVLCAGRSAGCGSGSGSSRSKWSTYMNVHRE